MRETILQGLEQAYNNFVRMIAEFLPHLLVMLIIIAVGLVVAFVFKYVLRTLLRLTRLDRVSEEAGASRVLRMAHLPGMTELAQPLSFLDNLVRLHFSWPERSRCAQSSGTDFPSAPVSA